MAWRTVFSGSRRRDFSSAVLRKVGGTEITPVFSPTVRACSAAAHGDAKSTSAGAFWIWDKRVQ